MAAISVIGAGYVGLVTGLGLAELGHEVLCVDMDQARVAEVASGRLPFHEPGLQEYLSKHAGSQFVVSESLEEAVAATAVTFVAVGTPSGPAGIDLRFVESAAADIGSALRAKTDRHVVVIKSTVVPGTTDGMVTEVLQRTSGKRAGEDFGVASNPEFLTEGRAVRDFFEPDRIVLGVDSEETANVLRDIYAPLGEVPVLVTNARTAEMIKYASNALLATMISFTNELANLGATLGGIDTAEVMKGVHLSRYLTSRVNGASQTAEIASFLEAGCGFGGSCLPKDIAALASHAECVHAGHSVLDAVLSTNREQPRVLVDVAERTLGSLSGRKVAVLGLAFKPDTSDTRETPAVPVIRELMGRGAVVIVHDPVVRLADLPEDITSQVVSVESVEEAAGQAEALLIVTRWDDYLRLPSILNRDGDAPLVVDGRRMLHPSSVPRYAGIGY